MPYADIDRKREYQRNWLKEKKTVTQGLKNKDGGRYIVRNIVTWEELQDTKAFIAKVKSYDECVEEAKKCFYRNNVDRLTVGGLAAQSVVIKLGGDRRTENWKDRQWKTIKDFSKEVGVSYKTLQGWVRAYIVSTQLKGVENICYNDARLAAFKMYRNENLTAQEAYESFALRTSAQKRASKVVQYLVSSSNYVGKYGTKHFTKEQLVRVKACVKALSSRV